MKDSENFLIDTSALIKIITYVSPDKLLKNTRIKLYIIPLTPFEANNVLWKFVIWKRITMEEARKLSQLLNLLIEYKILKIIQITNYTEILEFAHKNEINFYDSSYLYTAKQQNLILVTDDKRMETQAKTNKIKTIDSKKLTKYIM